MSFSHGQDSQMVKTRDGYYFMFTARRGCVWFCFLMLFRGVSILFSRLLFFCLRKRTTRGSFCENEKNTKNCYHLRMWPKAPFFHCSVFTFLVVFVRHRQQHTTPTIFIIFLLFIAKTKCKESSGIRYTSEPRECVREKRFFRVIRPTSYIIRIRRRRT